MTDFGEALIEELQVGDMVMTSDRGLQEILWIGHKKFDKVALEANPKLYPVRIRKGKLGKNIPKQNLMLSPHHRVKIRSTVAQRMFNIF